MTNKKKSLRHGRLPELLGSLEWYAILVPPQKEFAAQEILIRRGIATFVPFDSVWRYRSRYSKEKELRRYPFMPRYVFAGFCAKPDWFNILRLPILSSVVGIDGVPVPIAKMINFISEFKNGIRRPDHEKFMKTHREFGVGDLAIITESALAGSTVKVQSIEKGHAFFTVEMFGGEHRLSLALDKLEAA